ncbi:glucose-6-phosphate dehydrogenase [Fervidibacillus albus]|uniref:Glucose-6-phosphate 1-dehydrogenase n=1 Tax=Fervidibacillus albus TaxID=2980026 RepID=A0A9E8LVJ1_9BACI|nr:glucose-6-phosphate dehydrogenase [Fervidibacillus albus]WAA10483.1 glucose-6-phosphate dehydrogenase [Fervidibacillus albus]
MKQQKTPASLILLFGATGDLAKRKLYPSLYNLFEKGLLSDRFAVVGVARRLKGNEDFRNWVKDSIMTFGERSDQLEEFISHFYYQSHDVSDSSSYTQLKQLVDRLDEQYRLEGNRIFYLAMSPEFFGTVAGHLKADGLTETNGFKRLVIEKPFGHDLQSAIELNNEIRKAFLEEEIYRIDHYLGKEMVQNIEVIRFANAIFEPLWNNRYISNIQVTSSEILGVEDRARYYDKNGALRDMVQNHMMQIVSLLAMEPPIRLTTDEIRSEKVKVLRALRAIKPEEVHQFFVRGQYDQGMINGKEVPAYRDELNVSPDSNTETFVAGKLLIDNFRWAGVPFYIRTGKRMRKKSTKIVVQFKDIPMNLYYKNGSHLNPNLLVINVQPEEGITLHLNVKKTGQIMETTPIKLNFSTNSIDGMNTPEAYEKLLYDCLRGDATNFTHWDEVALSWKFIDTISTVWEQEKGDFPNYQAGSTGPKCSDELLAKDGFCWWSDTELNGKKC